MMSCLNWSACILAASVISAAGAWAEGPARSSETLTIVDLDGSKIPLSVEDLRKMPVDIEEELICVGHSSGFIGIFDYSGVRLIELFKKAKAAEAASEYRRENMYVLFRGTDGYQTLASWTELTMTTEGKRVMIAIDKNAEPLPPLEGKFRLVLPGDKWVGRSVKCLETIEIRCPDGVVDKKKDDKKEAKKP